MYANTNHTYPAAATASLSATTYTISHTDYGNTATHTTHFAYSIAANSPTASRAKYTTAHCSISDTVTHHWLSDHATFARETNCGMKPQQATQQHQHMQQPIQQMQLQL